MKVTEIYNLYFKKSGFVAPINDFLAKKGLSFEQEKFIYRINDRISKCINIAVQIHKLERTSKNQNKDIIPHSLINGLHCDLFTTLTSIYLCGKELFVSLNGNNQDEAKFWINKYTVSEDDKKNLEKPHFGEILLANNSTISPKYNLKCYGDFGEAIFFQCYDLNQNDLINRPLLSAENGIIRTKYFAIFSILFLLGYLSVLGKYLCFDEFGKDFKGKIEIVESPLVMKYFHEIANEWFDILA